MAKEGGGLAYTPRRPNPQKNNNMKNEDLEALAGLISANITYCIKEILTTDEAARYMGISKSHLYKLTMEKQIPHFKPMGKMCYFNRVEIEQWLQTNRVHTDDELSQKANAYLQRGGAR